MEGKSAACAHFSPMGNIAAAMCDLWSNESVQNVRLLSGSAPEAFTELLAYDCRLMNTAAGRGRALEMRDWLAASDASLSPQAAILTPDATIRIAEVIVSASDGYARVQKAAWGAISVLRDALSAGALELSPRERQWLSRIERELTTLPASEELLWKEMETRYAGVFDPGSYAFGLSNAHEV